MAPESLFAVAVVVIVVLAAIAKLIPKRQPPSLAFKCSRCGITNQHNNRTAEAWRNGKTKFFCQACHAKWLQSHPPPPRVSYARRGSSRGNSGCLVVVALFVLLPLGVWFVLSYA